jgi:hypothetical protein
MKDGRIVRDDVQKCFIKGQGREMRKLRKEIQTKSTPSVLSAEMTVQGKKEWRILSCPLTGEPYGRYCGEACAWYSEQSNSIPTMAPPAAEGGHPYKQLNLVTVVRCKGEPIGKLVEEEENTGKGFGYADDENSL